MKKINLLNLLIVVIFGVFGSLFLLASIYISRMTPSFIQNEGSKLTEIYINQDIKQKFKSSYDDISIVYIRLKNPGHRNTDQFTFYVEEEGRILREVNISGRNIGDDEWVKFQFEPVRNVQNKDLEIHLLSKTANINDTVSVYSNDKGELAVKVYSRQPLISSLVNSLNILKSRLTADPSFLIFYSAIIVILLIIYRKVKKTYG